MISEDFSFPKITNPLPHFAISPSLWRVSSLVYPDFGIEDQDEIAIKSLPVLKNEEDCAVKKECVTHTVPGEEERMDMLWEDFNEELKRASSLDKKKQINVSSNNRLNCDTGEEELQLFSVHAVKVSKRGRVCQPKKQSLVLVVKVLKKVFLLHKSIQLKKN